MPNNNICDDGTSNEKFKSNPMLSDNDDSPSKPNQDIKDRDVGGPSKPNQDIRDRGAENWNVKNQDMEDLDVDDQDIENYNFMEGIALDYCEHMNDDFQTFSFYNYDKILNDYAYKIFDNHLEIMNDIEFNIMDELKPAIRYYRNLRIDCDKKSHSFVDLGDNAEKINDSGHNHGSSCVKNFLDLKETVFETDPFVELYTS